MAFVGRFNTAANILPISGNLYVSHSLSLVQHQASFIAPLYISFVNFICPSCFEKFDNLGGEEALNVPTSP